MLQEQKRIEYDVMNTIRKRQLKWYCHMCRMKEERIPLKVWKWKPAEKIKTGKPTEQWMNEVN